MIVPGSLMTVVHLEFHGFVAVQVDICVSLVPSVFLDSVAGSASVSDVVCHALSFLPPMIPAGGDELFFCGFFFVTVFKKFIVEHVSV